MSPFPKTWRFRRTTRAVAVFAVAAGMVATLVAGCSAEGVSSVPLPGGVATGGDAYRVRIQFSDVLDLVAQSSVKVNDVTVGSVERIQLERRPTAVPVRQPVADGGAESGGAGAGVRSVFAAIVTVRLKSSVVLPDNAIAGIRQTSLLGEKYVELGSPPGGAVGRLSGGDEIPLARTSRDYEVEEVLGALSLVLNGGAVEQIRTINRELSAALSGREPQIRSLLTELNTFVGGLNQQKANIIRALANLNRLAISLNRQKATITGALDDIGPGVKVVGDQHAQLTQTLTALSRLGAVANRVITASKDNLVADLKLLQPTLTQLANAGTNLPNGLEMLATYPFPRNVQNAIYISDGRAYVNLSMSLDLDLAQVLGNLFSPEPQGTTPQPVGGAGTTGGAPVPGVDGPLNQLPGVTTSLPGQAAPGGGSAGGGAGGSGSGGAGPPPGVGIDPLLTGGTR